MSTTLRTLIVCIFCLISFEYSAQEKTAFIDLSKNYEAGLSEDNYYQLFQLPLILEQKQIEEFKVNSLKYKFVKDISVVKTSEKYDVRLLLDKETENISGYFRDYLLSLSINALIINNEKIKTEELYVFINTQNKSLIESKSSIEK